MIIISLRQHGFLEDYKVDSRRSQERSIGCMCILCNYCEERTKPGLAHSTFRTLNKCCGVSLQCVSVCSVNVTERISMHVIRFFRPTGAATALVVTAISGLATCLQESHALRFSCRE